MTLKRALTCLGSFEGSEWTLSGLRLTLVGSGWLWLASWGPAGLWLTPAGSIGVPGEAAPLQPGPPATRGSSEYRDTSAAEWHI